MQFQHFQKLGYQDQALLLYLELFSPEHVSSSLDRLTSERQQTLLAAQQELSSLDADERLNTLGQLLKSTRRYSEQQIYLGVHPSWLAHALRAETHTIIALVLRSMPQTVAEQVGRYIPDAVKDLLPPKTLLDKVSSELDERIVRTFQRQFPRNKKLKFLDTERFESFHLLDHHDFQHIIIELGVRELVAAFQALPKRDFAAFLKQTHHALAERLIACAQKTTAPGSTELSKAVLEAVQDVMQNDKELYVKAGLFRLSRACRLLPTEARTKIVFSLHRQWGLTLESFFPITDRLEQAEATPEEIEQIVAKFIDRGKIKGLSRP